MFEAGDVAEAALAVNRILEESRAQPYVSVHGGRPHLHVEPLRAGLGRWLGAVVGMGLAFVLIEDGISRFGVCSAADCRDVFLDTSRNRSRKRCSDTCTNREGVAFGAAHTNGAVDQRSSNWRAAELMQYRWPVGRGPSGKTWPRCPPHVAQRTSVLTIPWEVSSFSSTRSRATG